MSENANQDSKYKMKAIMGSSTNQNVSGNNETLKNEEPIIDIPRNEKQDTKKIPNGFLSFCPFTGYDPDKSSRIRMTSAIYSQSQFASKKGISKLQPITVSKKKQDIPSEYTTDRHPILWPSYHENLALPAHPSDFLVNGPLLFEIIQPGTRYFRKILCRIRSINKYVSSISVQQEDDEK